MRKQKVIKSTLQTTPSDQNQSRLESFLELLSNHLNDGWLVVPGTVTVVSSGPAYFAVIEKNVPNHIEVDNECIEEDCCNPKRSRSNYCADHRPKSKVGG